MKRIGIFKLVNGCLIQEGWEIHIIVLGKAQLKLGLSRSIVAVKPLLHSVLSHCSRKIDCGMMCLAFSRKQQNWRGRLIVCSQPWVAPHPRTSSMHRPEDIFGECKAEWVQGCGFMALRLFRDWSRQHLLHTVLTCQHLLSSSKVHRTRFLELSEIVFR